MRNPFKMGSVGMGEPSLDVLMGSLFDKSFVNDMFEEMRRDLVPELEEVIKEMSYGKTVRLELDVPLVIAASIGPVIGDLKQRSARIALKAATGQSSPRNATIIGIVLAAGLDELFKEFYTHALELMKEAKANEAHISTREEAPATSTGGDGSGNDPDMP